MASSSQSPGQKQQSDDADDTRKATNSVWDKMYDGCETCYFTSKLKYPRVTLVPQPDQQFLSVRKMKDEGLGAD